MEASMLVEWVLAFAAFTALAATGFVVVAVLWLKKLRETVSTTLGETAGQQIRTAQRLSEAIGQTQKQQQQHEQRLQTLLQANMRLRQDLSTIIARMETNERERQSQPDDRTLH